MPIEVRRLSPEWGEALAELFRALEATEDSKHFHPHPLTPHEAVRRCRYEGNDLYYILVEERKILGYGMLRGWDEGYETPSLGIAIHPSERNKGLGKVFMHFLHAAAIRNGAKRVRLRVSPDNLGAIKLYEALGYEFEGQENGEVVGVFDAGSTADPLG
jgi:[ribosomal protein S18]-alanine N-acetyltransferase